MDGDILSGAGIMRAILRWLGFEIVYVCEWGEYETRYDACDHHFGRHIHMGMTTAPPWAKMRIRRLP